jgi:hypothetical protein
MASNIFSMIIRIWFYSELFKSADPNHYGGRSPPRPRQKNPLHKAIFSFIFGDKDPNAEWSSREKQVVIAYIQANRGVLSLPELMSLTGLPPDRAEERISAYCVEFGGSPEATDDGTVVYRFDELLLRADTQARSFPDFSAPLKRLKAFSANAKKMNAWFSIINGANLIFGGYFLFNALKSGAILTQAQFQASSYLYGVSYVLLSEIIHNPLPAITIGMGVVPLIFSVLFWLIPGFRYFKMKRENETIKLENFKKDGFGRIWHNPFRVNPKDINPQAEECHPGKLAAAQDRVIKELGAYAVPDVEVDEAGSAVYTFQDLDREKKALDRYRETIDPGASDLGKTVFDSEA